MEDTTKTDIETGTVPAEKEPSQSPIKKELDRVKTPRTHREKLLFSKKKIEEELAKEEGEEGIEITADEDDNKPMTRGEFKKIQREQSQKTALQMADDIQDEDERELTKHYLQTRVIPSGNPQEDLRFARSAVTSIKSMQIAQEVKRGQKPIVGGHGSGGPSLEEEQFEATKEEIAFANFAKIPPTEQKAWILGVRAKQNQ